MKIFSTTLLSIVCLFMTANLTASSSLLLGSTATETQANYAWLGLKGASNKQIQATSDVGLSSLIHHPFVVVPHEAAVLAADPDALNIQNVNGVECYATLDRLEICGAADTIPIVLYTKSEESLTEIRVNVEFSEGLEYAGFVIIPDEPESPVAAPAGVFVDGISAANPESITFLISEINESIGNVVVYIGVRAECGADLAANPATATFNYDYTSPTGAACTGSFTPPAYSAVTIEPVIEFVGDPAPINRSLNAAGDTRCQILTITQTTPGAGASGFEFTTTDYGFADGIMINRLDFDGATVDPTDYTIASDGTLTFATSDITADGTLSFNENTTITVCYTYADCFPNVNYSPDYSIVTSCDGVVCSSQIDFSSGILTSNFSQNPDFQAVLIDDPLGNGGPDICAGTPYEVDVVISTTIADRINGKIENIRATLLRCAVSGLSLSSVAVVGGIGGGGDGSELDPSLYSVLGTDNVDDDTGAILALAGTISVNLLGNTTVSGGVGGGLSDTDGDGSFDDLYGDETLTLRFTFDPDCGDGDASCAAPGSLVDGGGDPFPECQFNEITLSGLSGCGTRNENITIPLTGGSTFENASRGEFTDLVDFTYGSTTFTGYNFGMYGGGVSNTNSTTDVNSIPVTRTLDFEYDLASSPLSSCPMGDGTVTLQLSILGPAFLTEDIVFSNVTFESPGGTAPATSTSTSFDADGNLVLEIDNSSGTALATTFSFSVDVTLDTSLCGPPSLAFIEGVLSTACAGTCASCSPAQVCNAVPIVFDPEAMGCINALNTEIILDRESIGYTDETRTDDFDYDNFYPAADPDRTRLLSGDTLIIRQEVTFPAGIDPIINPANRSLTFQSAFSGTRDALPAIFDYNLLDLKSMTVTRGDGTTTNLLASFSGPTQGDQTERGLRIGFNIANTNVFDVGDKELTALPNGGFTFYAANSGADQLDASFLQIVFFNGDDFDVQALDELFAAVGGAFLEDDVITIEWAVPVVDNPGVSTTPLTDILLLPAVAGTTYDAGNSGTFSSLPIGYDERIPDAFEYYSPVVDGTATINYTDECNAEMVVRYEINDLPAGWYEDEVRLAAGLEQFSIDIPYPYYYAGGAMWESPSTGMMAVEPDATLNMDTVVAGGQQLYVPSGGTGTSGQLAFIDAEFTDGVRDPGYTTFYTGTDADRDITTVGGTFPLISVGGSGTQSFIEFTIPLLRACGEAPPTAPLALNFDAANKHLPDLSASFPYYTDNGYWDGKVRDNDGNLVTPVGIKYFPFDRLPNGTYPAISRERQLDNMVAVTEIGAPSVLMATLTIDDGMPIADMPGNEQRTVTICPSAGEVLAGSVKLTTGAAISLAAVTGNGASVTPLPVSFSDTLNVYAIAIPAGLAADACFDLAITTDLLYCGPGEICVEAILGCNTDPETLVQVISELDLDCGNLELCYTYDVTVPGVTASFMFATPVDLCATNTYTIQFVNDGTADLMNFSPTFFLPLGLTGANFLGTITEGVTDSPLTAPTNSPALDDVFGAALLFSQAELNALFATSGSANFEAGDVLTITFDGTTSCDFIPNSPLAVFSGLESPCEGAEETDLIISENLAVNTGEVPQIEVLIAPTDGPINLSCSDDGTALEITINNFGKADNASGEFCLIVPGGLTIDAAGIVATSPSDFSVTAADITTTPVASMANQYCFALPVLPAGKFVCLEIPIEVGAIDCGPVFIGAMVTTEAELTCVANASTCSVMVNTVETPFFPINIVPPVNLANGMIMTACGSTPGLFDVNFSVDMIAESGDFAGDIVYSLFSDVDGNGELDETIDTQIGTSQTQAVSLTEDEAQAYMGTFADVDQGDVCPLLLKAESMGCTCSVLVLPFDEVLPDFLTDLGTAINLCPGESFVIDGICADLDYAFADPTAGTIVKDLVAGTATVSLNTGRGIVSPEVLNITGIFGGCNTMASLDVSQTDVFEFGPYTYTVCNTQTQEVDLNIPAALQDDIQVTITPSTSIVDGTTTEPKIVNLQADQVYTVEFSLNDGQCLTSTTLTATVEEAVTITAVGGTGCLTGFRLDDKVMVAPTSTTGEFQTMGDGTFSPSAIYNGSEIQYTPGPMDRAAETVNFRFITDVMDGSVCGPSVERFDFEILIVDCGTFPWGGSSPAGGGN